MVSPEEIIDILPDKPLSLNQVERLENVSGIDLAEGCAGGSEGEHAIVLAGGNWAIGIAYTDEWEVVDSIVGDCRQEHVMELMNETAMYRHGGME